MEFLINSMKLYNDVENIVIYDKKNDKFYGINELYHIYTYNNKEYMVIEI